MSLCAKLIVRRCLWLTVNVQTGSPLRGNISRIVGLRCLDIVGHEGRVQFEEAAVSAAAIFYKVHAIETAEPFEEERVFNVCIDFCLSPAIVHGAELGSKIAQHYERGAGNQPLLNRGPQCQWNLRYFIDDNDARPRRPLVEAVMERAAGTSLHADVLGRAVGVRARQGLAPLRDLLGSERSSGAPKALQEHGLPTLHQVQCFVEGRLVVGLIEIAPVLKRWFFPPFRRAYREIFTI